MSSIESGSVAHTLAHVRSLLEAAGVPDPDTDAQLIIGHVLGVTRGRVQALAILEETIDDDRADRIRSLAEQRAARVPLQHLTGKAPFRHLELHVGPGVFVPRPETELIAQLAIDELAADPHPNPRALDLCTGSGAIALALATEIDRAHVWAIEKDEDAHAWASRNVEELGDGRVTLIRGDVSDPPHDITALKGTLSVIATNPPYVPATAIPRDPEVREHDPELALYSGDDGLDLIRQISRTYRPYLKPGGLIVIEHAEIQGEAVREILAADGWGGTATHRDLTFRDRATTARA